LYDKNTILSQFTHKTPFLFPKTPILYVKTPFLYVKNPISYVKTPFLYVILAYEPISPLKNTPNWPQTPCPATSTGT
jgi:hypothetical protein